MRISSFEIHRQAATQLQELGADAARTQQQIAHGKRIVNPSDDPIGAARAVRLKQEMGVRDQYLTNAQAANTQLALEESVLQQITEAIHRVQELTIQAGSGAQTADDRRFIAAEIEARFEELVALVNARGPSGQYLFGGFRSQEPPFVVAGESISYRGDDGQRKIQIDRGQFVAMNDSGEQLFIRVDSERVRVNGINLPLDPDSSQAAIGSLDVVDQTLADELYPDELVIEFRPLSEGGGQPNFNVTRKSDGRSVDGLVNIAFDSGTTVTAGGIAFAIDGSPQVGDKFQIQTVKHQGLLQTVKNAASGLKQIDAVTRPEAFQDLIGATLVGLDSATNNILEVRADIGARFNSIDAATDLHEDLTLQLQETLSEVEDLDFAEAISQLSFQSFVLEAAQQSFIRINSLSLFNRL